MSNFNTNFPSAPEEKKELPKVDLDIEGDGIDDETHNMSNFLREIGTGCPGLSSPNIKRDKTWPSLPENVQGIDNRFFREPDFIADSKNPSDFEKDFLVNAKALKWIHTRDALTQAKRYTGGALLALTGVGAVYLYGKYKHINVGHIGFCTDLDESVRLLLPGHHCEYNPTHGDIQTFPITQDYITFLNRARIIRVHPGEYVVVKINDQYQLLKPGQNHSVGVHMFDEPKFEFVKRVKQTNSAILAGPINIITVPPGRLARILLENKPYILFEGQHMITSGLLEFGDRILSNEDREERKQDAKDNNVGFSNLKDTFIYHSIGKVYVRPGELVGIQINKRAVFLEEPGDYWFYSDQIEMSKPVSKTVNRFDFSSLVRIYIKENEYGVVQRANGMLEILQNGCHTIEIPNKFLVSLPKTIQFRELSGLKGITNDPLDITFSMIVSYKIVEPFKAYLLGSQNSNTKDCDMFKIIDETVLTSATSTMQSIVRHLNFRKMLSQNMNMEDKQDLQPGSLKEQFETVSSASVKQLQKRLRDVFGVELNTEEYNISKLDLTNQKEQDELNRAAFESSKARAILVKAENDRKVAEYEKRMIEIKAETEVARRLIEAKSENEIKTLNAQAKANELRIQTESEAKNLELMSKAKALEISEIGNAEANVIKHKGEAEGYAKEKYSDTTQLKMVENLCKMFQGTHLTMVDSKDGLLGPVMANLLKSIVKV